MIKTEFSYSEEELRDFFKFHLLNKEKTKYIYFGSLLIIAVIGLLLIIVFDDYAVLGFLLLLLALVLAFLFPLLVKRTINKQVHSRYKRPEQAIIFSEEKITQNIGDKIIEYNWDSIIEVCETDKYIYLYISQNSALIVTKSTIGDAKYKQLKTLITSKVKK